MTIEEQIDKWIEEGAVAAYCYWNTKKGRLHFWPNSGSFGVVVNGSMKDITKEAALAMLK